MAQAQPSVYCDIVNDRNGKNQFRPKPKFRPKFYQKIHENEEVFSIFFSFQFGLTW